MSAITVENIYRSFGRVQAVNGLSFQVDPGQVVGFIGANGAGKTTTMRMMVTLDVPDTGRIEICGLDVFDHPREVRRLVGWMPDHFGAYTNMDVWEYLDFYGRAFGLKGPERSKRMDEVMAFTDMDVLAERPCNRLSKGQTQRLCLSRALLSDPQVLVLDEPAAGLDPRARIEFKNLVKLLAARGKTLFISSHILSELGEMCDHLLFIDQGRQIHQGTSDSLRFHKDDGRIYVRLRLLGEPYKFEQWLSTRSGVTAQRQDDGHLQLLVEKTPEGTIEGQLAELLREMIAAGVDVYEFHRVERRLEDAFVEILGGQPS